jgi:hypothetical protein
VEGEGREWREEGERVREVGKMETGARRLLGGVLVYLL